MSNLSAYLIEAFTILGGLNALASAVLLCVPKTSPVYPYVATVATDIKAIWSAIGGIVGKPVDVTADAKPEEPAK